MVPLRTPIRQHDGVFLGDTLSGKALCLSLLVNGGNLEDTDQSSKKSGSRK